MSLAQGRKREDMIEAFLLLHFYQPYDQEKHIIDRVLRESYLPLINLFRENPSLKAIFNISGSLTKLLLENGYSEFVDGLKELLISNQIELTATSMYHAFLPLLPEKEILRQINLNNDFYKQLLGDLYLPSGFYSPELAISEELLSVVSSEFGYTWFACPKLCVDEKVYNPNLLYRHKSTGSFLFIRNKEMSNTLLSGYLRDERAVDSVIASSADRKIFKWYLAMDAETFGHHRVGYVKDLQRLLLSEEIHTSTLKDCVSQGPLSEKTVDISVRSCTWSNTEQDFWLKNESGEVYVNSFSLWKDNDNPIHRSQWELLDYVLDILNKSSKEENYSYAREVMDYAVSSDQFWWASAKPWWSIEMVEKGAYLLTSVVEMLHTKDSEEYHKAQALYQEIMRNVFWWHRTGRSKNLGITPEERGHGEKKDPMLLRTSPEWFNQIMLELEYEMLRAEQTKNYELAIKWRDAIYKLSLMNDDLDVLHVVDELWSFRPDPWNTTLVKPFLEHDWSEFSDFIKKFLIYVSSEEDLLYWKEHKKPKKHQSISL